MNHFAALVIFLRKEVILYSEKNPENSDIKALLVFPNTFGQYTRLKVKSMQKTRKFLLKYHLIRVGIATHARALDLFLHHGN